MKYISVMITIFGRPLKVILWVSVGLTALALQSCSKKNIPPATTNKAPIAAFTMSPSSGTNPLKVTFDASDSKDPDGNISDYQWKFGDGKTGSGFKTDHTYTDAGTFQVELTVIDNKKAKAAANRTVSVTTRDIDLPPDPATVASVIDQTVVTDFATATEFLYTGPNPIQQGVAPGTMDERRVAVLRGKVLDRTNQPLSGVEITILNHPEFGKTLSRADGIFDMAVNGGGILTMVRNDFAATG